MKYLLAFLLAVMVNANTQGVRAQAPEDMKVILMQIVNMPQIQSYYQTDDSGNRYPITIWQNLIVFPESVTQSDLNELVSFQNSQQISAYKPGSYMLFSEFQFINGKAHIAFDLHYNANDIHNKAKVAVTCKFIQDGADWQLLEFNIGGQ